MTYDVPDKRTFYILDLSDEDHSRLPALFPELLAQDLPGVQGQGQGVSPLYL